MESASRRFFGLSGRQQTYRRTGDQPLPVSDRAMTNRTTGAWDRAENQRHRSATYQLKLELRRLERTGRGDSPYAKALRRVLRAFSERDLDAVIRLLGAEIKRLEHEDGTDDSYTNALRRAVSLIEPAERSDRQLFTYYLRKMELDGRGQEPFARALRKALASPGGPSLKDLLVWKDAEEDGA